jgi:hypothetical protein
MGKNSASAVVHDASRRLNSVWSEVIRDWQDDVAKRFVREFWEPLSEIVGRYCAALEELEVALDDAEIDE